MDGIGLQIVGIIPIIIMFSTVCSLEAVQQVTIGMVQVGVL